MSKGTFSDRNYSIWIIQSFTLEICGTVTMPVIVFGVQWLQLSKKCPKMVRKRPRTSPKRSRSWPIFFERRFVFYNVIFRTWKGASLNLAKNVLKNIFSIFCIFGPIIFGDICVYRIKCWPYFGGTCVDSGKIRVLIFFGKNNCRTATAFRRRN